MRYVYPPVPWFDLLGQIVWFVTEELARARAGRLPRPVVRRGATLRPGSDTPCWNLLVADIAPQLRRRGAKALLARELGLHRARMTDFFVRRAAMPDAERLLRLLAWRARQAPPGGQPATIKVRPVRHTNKHRRRRPTGAIPGRSAETSR